MVEFKWICELDVPPVGQCIGYNSKEDTFHYNGSFDTNWFFRSGASTVKVDYYLTYEDLRKMIPKNA